MGISCLLTAWVIGYSRVPAPPAMMMPFISPDSSVAPFRPEVPEQFALPFSPDGPGPRPHRRAHDRPRRDAQPRRLDDHLPSGSDGPAGAPGGGLLRPHRQAHR